MIKDFVHLHNHSEFSLLDGLAKIEEMVEHAKNLGMKALAITDHGNMYGTIKFYKACLEAKIKPIIGCEVYIAKRSMLDKEADQDKDYNHLILLAKNEIGYKNLMKLVTIANLEGFYYKPRIDLEHLKKYKDGLICLSACVNGFASEPLSAGDEEKGEKNVKILYEIFGEKNFYLELQRHVNVPPQEKVNQKLVKISRKLGIPIVATNDNHYVKRTDAEAQEILLCLQTQTTLLDKNRKLSMISSPDFYMKSPEEMTKLFSDLPEAIENTLEIADNCNLEIPLGKWIMPNFEVPLTFTPEEYLKKQVYDGAKKRYDELTQPITERIDHELSVILKKGYESYFFIVADFVNWAKSKGISVGPGRGSAAGSVVSYSLGITDVDPFFFNLPFERFLNPLRPSAPDIDLDFADTRRDEVIDYVASKYGKDRVAQIITFGTMEARGSVRDVGRVLGMPYAGPDRIAKMIPPGWQGHAMTLDRALEQSPDLKRAYLEEETKHLIDLAKKLEGVARHASVHAAGVVISDKPLVEYAPLQRETNGEKIVTQYDMYTIGEDGVGLLKMDFLGLRNLTIIEETLRFIKQNQNIEINLSKIPLDDKKTYDLLSSGETTGIFQLESAGMRRYIKELRPSSIFDLMAMVALYRPGPMQNIPDFIARKHNPNLIKYPDERLKDVLKESYGIIAYQDDVLLTAIKLAGYSWLDADKLRKAVGKKIPAEMKKQREKFIKGAMENGIKEKKAEELFDLITPFAGYGFNKAHAAGYATIAFRTAYLKAHFPVEFMTALLTAESRGASGPIRNEKISQGINECRRLNIEILPPSINFSESDFTIEENKKIRFGLSAIKNVGSAAIQTILSSRLNGKFKSFYNFCQRVDLSKVNKKTLESLIKGGAMSEFGNTASLLASIQNVVEKINKIEKTKNRNQTGLFDNLEDLEETFDSDIEIPEIDDFSLSDRLMFEKELLGFYLTAHPFKQEIERLASEISHPIQNLLEEKGQIAKLKTGGIVIRVKKIVTRVSNNEMAFVTIEDENGLSIECVVFPRTFETTKNLILKDAIVIIEGKLEQKDDRPVILVSSISSLINH